MDAETMEPKIVIMMDPAYLKHEDEELTGSASVDSFPAAELALDAPGAVVTRSA